MKTYVAVLALLIAVAPIASASPLETNAGSCEEPDGIVDETRCGAGAIVYDVCATVLGKDACKAINIQ